MPLVPASVARAARKLAKTPLHRPALAVRAGLNRCRVGGTPARERRTTYMISPYKTGTTYAHNAFAKVCRSAHEPMHYDTIRYLDDIGFLAGRERHLDLDFEASGFFAGRIDTLRQIHPEARVLLAYRPFTDWAVSFLNYFEKVANFMHYNYPVRMLFDPFCRFPADRYRSLGTAERGQVVRGLFAYWRLVYEDAVDRHGVLVVPLGDFDARLPEIADFLGLPRPPGAGKDARYTNPDKQDLDVTDHLDTAELEEVSARIEHALGLAGSAPATA